MDKLINTNILKIDSSKRQLLILVFYVEFLLVSLTYLLSEKGILCDKPNKSYELKGYCLYFGYFNFLNNASHFKENKHHCRSYISDNDKFYRNPLIPVKQKRILMNTTYYSYFYVIKVSSVVVTYLFVKVLYFYLKKLEDLNITPKKLYINIVDSVLSLIFIILLVFYLDYAFFGLFSTLFLNIYIVGFSKTICHLFPLFIECILESAGFSGTHSYVNRNCILKENMYYSYYTLIEHVILIGVLFNAIFNVLNDIFNIIWYKFNSSFSKLPINI